MSITKLPIYINRSLPYSANLANAINEYWKEQVAVPDGCQSAFEGSVYMNSEYGIPVKVRRRSHPAIVRIRRGPNNKWFIVDQEDR